MRKAIYVTLALGVLVLGLLIGWARIAKPAAKLGANQGRLAACPDSPNCVSSQANDEVHQVFPLTFTGDGTSALKRLRTIIESMARATVVTATDGYLHAEFRSAFVGYIDDVECLIDPTTSVIHIRSASRVGYSDLGANRKRVEAIRTAFDGG